MSELHAHVSRRRAWLTCALLVVILGGVCFCRLGMGSTGFGVPLGIKGWEIWQVRGFRLALGLIVGVALSISGVSLQALLRNPLAEPYILGLSTGAAAGMMAQLWLVYQWGITLGGSQTGAVIGAAASMGIVYAASRRQGMLDPIGLLLTGVVLSTINAAVMMLFNYLSRGIRHDMARWMMGFLNENASTRTVYLIAAITGLGFAVLWWYGRAMDVATLSDAEAQSLGVNLSRLRTVLFATASILAAGAVTLAGPIAFVGLICPHLGRLLVGPRHRTLLVVAALLGGALVVGADVISAAIDMEWRMGMMPIGIFTAMIGGPAFLWMLRSQLGKGAR